MSLTVKDFADRAAQGPGRIRLSGKKQPDGKLGLSKRKGALGGRVVEWFHGVTGKGHATSPFLEAMRREYGTDTTAQVCRELRVDEGTPLTSRVVTQVMRAAKRGILHGHAPTSGSASATGYASAVEEARIETGAVDEDVADLHDDAAAKHVRHAIRGAIEAAGNNGETIVGEDAARSIAREKTSQYLRSGQQITQALAGLDLKTKRARKLLSGIKNFTVQRFYTPAKNDQQIQRDIDHHVRDLNSDEVLKAYRDLLSPDMVEMRAAIAATIRSNPYGPDVPTLHLLLADLNSYEDAVRREMIERTDPRYAGRDDVEGFVFADRGPRAGQLAALGATEERAARRELNNQTDGYLRGESRDRTALPGVTEALRNTGVTPEEFAKVLDDSELTVNLSRLLLRERSGALFKSPQLKNIYQLPQVKGPHYLDRRREIEHTLESKTKLFDKEQGIDPANHPISAGINVDRRTAGAAPGYGDVVLVLNDQVKDRCTFTARDSFDVFEAEVTEYGVAAFMTEVAKMLAPGGGLPEKDRLKLLADPEIVPSISAALNAMIGQTYGANRPFLETFAQGPMLKVGPASGLAQYLLANAAIKIFATPGSAYVSTRDRIGELAESLEPKTVNAMVAGKKNEALVNLPIGRHYMEAQVYGGIDLRTDVREIRYIAQDTTTMTSRERRDYRDFLLGVRRLCRESDIRLVRYTPAEAAALI